MKEARRRGEWENGIIMTRGLWIAASAWAVGITMLTVFLSDIEERIWFLYDILAILTSLGGLVILALCLKRSFRDRRALVGGAIVGISGAAAFYYSDFLSIDVRFRVSQPYYEMRLREILESDHFVAADDVAGIEGTGESRVAFIWNRGVTDNWVGLIHDPSDSLLDETLSSGQADYFGGRLVFARHLNGHWYLCGFT